MGYDYLSIDYYFSKHNSGNYRSISSITVTGPGNTGLIFICTKYLACIMAPISSSIIMCYTKSVSFIEFLMDFCIYDDILGKIQNTDKNYYILNSQNQLKFMCRKDWFSQAQCHH